MKRLTKRAEELLSEILVHRDENGNCESAYWKDKFDNLSASEDVVIRGLFKELKEAAMISVQWADNFPYYMAVLANGISYFEEIKRDEDSMKQSASYTNNFYGTVKGIQIQQGTNNSTQTQSMSDDLEIAKELVEIIKKYNDVLEIEYGEANAIALRKSAESLEQEKEPTKMKAIINYIRNLSVNAGGGLIASGIIQLISTMR